VVPPSPGAKLANLQAMIAAKSLAEAVKLLKGVVPASPRSRASDEEAVDSVEDFLTSESMKVASKAFIWQGFGLATALALTKLLEFEVKNLAAIAIGIEAHVDAKDVLSKLVL